MTSYTGDLVGERVSSDPASHASPAVAAKIDVSSLRQEYYPKVGEKYYVSTYRNRRNSGIGASSDPTGPKIYTLKSRVPGGR